MTQVSDAQNIGIMHPSSSAAIKTAFCIVLYSPVVHLWMV